MKFVRKVFYNFWHNLRACFSLKNILWQVLGVVVTFVCVMTGFDWKYFETFSHGWILAILFPATIIGFLIPWFLPFILLAASKEYPKLFNTSAALAQAGIMGWLISTVYKIFTGRAHPILFSDTDISHVFRFGFFRGGGFWGWPSSHTTVAFALAVVLIRLYPGSKTIKLLAIVYALYIGIGVSVSIHWFSDFLAGAIIGTIIGVAVGNSFYKQTINSSSTI